MNPRRQNVPGNRHAGRRAARAFTLLELMLALFIFSMVIVAIYASWHAVLRSIRVGDQAAAEAQRARVASRALETALGSSVMFLMNRDLYRFEADTSEEFAALSFVARLPQSFPGSGYYGDQVVRRVAFVVEPGEDNVNELRLIQFPILAGEIDDEQLHPLTLARDVSLFMLEFNDGRSDEWMDEWTNTNALPRLVRFALAFGKRNDGAGTPREMVVRSVLLPGTAVPPVFQGTVRGPTRIRARGAPTTTTGELGAGAPAAALRQIRP